MSDNQSDVGIKIAKPQFNVNNAGDTDLILNSSWPTLQIVYEQTVPIVRTAGFPFTFFAESTHNLGYPAFFSIWAVYYDGSTERLVDLEKYVGSLTDVTVSPTKIKVSGGGDVSDFNMSHVHFKLYNIDLSKDVEYPFIQPPKQQTSTDNNFGIKMVKEGKSLDSTDMRDYLIHSRCQSPLVLAVKTEETAINKDDNGGTVSYQSPYKFLSWVFGYVRSGDTYRVAPYFGQAYPVTSIDSNNFKYSLRWVTAAGDDGATILVLRDPFFTGTDVEASY